MKHERDLAPATDAGFLPNGARELRRFLRHRVEAEGFTRVKGRTYRLKLTDLSEQGCQFRLPWSADFRPRTTINLRIGQMGPFPAVVRWSRGAWVGVEFDIPVYGPVLDHMCETLGTEADNPTEMR